MINLIWVSQLNKNYFILEKNRLNTFWLRFRSASRTAVTIFTCALFHPLHPFTCRILQEMRICLCSLCCCDEAGHQHPSAQCRVPPNQKGVQSTGKNPAHQADSCFRFLATGIVCRGASGGSWVNEGLARCLKMDMSVGNQNRSKIK